MGKKKERRFERQHILVEARVEAYTPYLVEYSRSSSRGGNHSAMHRHNLRIAGKTYSFLARGWRQWAYRTDAVSFEWEWDRTRKFRHILVHTFVTVDQNGAQILRGDRRAKKQWRTTPARQSAWLRGKND